MPTCVTSMEKFQVGMCPSLKVLVSAVRVERVDLGKRNGCNNCLLKSHSLSEGQANESVFSMSTQEYDK